MTKVNTKDDGLFGNSSKLQKSNVLSYWEKGKNGSGITVAILDESPYIRPGIMDSDHFSAPISSGKSATHATNCAQVVHAVAPEAKIIMLPALNADRYKSLEWIKANSPDIISISLKMGTDMKYVEELKKLNIPIVAAAGNNGPGRDDCAIPARYDWTICVGGFSEGTNDIYLENTSGKSMDCVAYTYINVESKPGYSVPFSGTSAATPWLAGMLACYYTKTDKRSNLKIPDVYTLRKFISQNCKDVRDPGKDIDSGYGLFILPDVNTIIKEEMDMINKSEFVNNQPNKEDEDMTITMNIGSNIANIDGKAVKMDTAPLVQNGRTLVPLRFIAETLGCTVNYNSGKITIIKE